MDTIPEPLALRNSRETPLPRRSGFRVPFGHRDGRFWAPAEVPKGKACGCVCPGCGAPLAAKAKESRRKRAHFAHLADAGCATGRETGIHGRAKQLIADRQVLALPAWLGDLVDMPNPPVARDDTGLRHLGRKVDHPARLADLQHVEVERSFGDYRPDVYARDDVGELLIEILVTHAVDEAKASRVQAHGQRMIEIDLSQLDRDTPHDLAAFEHAVLLDIANRHWISCPDAVEDWLASKHDLDELVDARNREIAQQREEQAQAAAKRLVRDVADAKDKAGRKAHMRTLLRAKHEDDLAQLATLTAPERIDRILRDSQVEAQTRVGELLDAAPHVVRSVCLRTHHDAWVFGVDPVLWQLLAFQHFVANNPPSSRFNQQEMARWVRMSFHPERALYRLFVAQYASRAEARRAGYAKRRLNYWVFTEEENAQIPNFYEPINDFVRRLEGARLVRLLPTPVGECEVLPTPTAGFHPAAHVGK